MGDSQLIAAISSNIVNGALLIWVIIIISEKMHVWSINPAWGRSYLKASPSARLVTKQHVIP